MAKKIIRKINKKMGEPENMIEKETENNNESDINLMEGIRKNRSYTIIIVLVLIVLGILLFKNKDLFLAAVVNNKPIFTWELNSKLRQRYGVALIDEMVSEKLLLIESEKKGLTVSATEIAQKVKEAQDSVGGADKLKEVLTQRGMTMKDLEDQIKYRLLVEKMLADKTKVTDKEIETYIEKNKETIASAAGTDSATWKKYATDFLKSEKMSVEFEKWFAEIKAKAKIEKFVK